jgi:hypothetical protein
MVQIVRDFVRRTWRITLAASVLVLLVIIPFFVLGIFRGDLRSHRATDNSYFRGIAEGNVALVKKNVCLRVRRTLGPDSEWIAVINKELRRVGGIEGYELLRGEARLAVVALRTRRTNEEIHIVPIVEENGRLLPCPKDSRRLLGVIESE